MNVSSLSCIVCGRRYADGEALYTCADCGDEGILDVEYDWERVIWRPSDERSIWRYLPMLPVHGDLGLPSLAVGMTPIVESPRLGARLGVRRLWLKDDGRLPTGSFKDRASAVGTVKARELGRDVIACASTGNAAVSLAGFAANLGQRAIIFVPMTAPEAKVAQLRAFAATVLLVEGTYEEAYALCQAAVQAFGWYNRNCAVNPYLVEGKKTCGLEIGEQLASEPPDVVAVSVGDGCTLAGIWKGLCEMHQLGVLPQLPRMLGVQATGAAPLVEAFSRGVEELRPVRAETCADSIAVGEPRNWRKALRAVRASRGAFVSVTDDEILDAAREVPAATGIFAEPTAAAGVAGLRAAVERGLVDSAERALVVITGNGLKDVRGATRKAPAATRVALSLDDVRHACHQG